MVILALLGVFLPQKSAKNSAIKSEKKVISFEKSLALCAKYLCKLFCFLCTSLALCENVTLYEQALLCAQKICANGTCVHKTCFVCKRFEQMGLFCLCQQTLRISVQKKLAGASKSCKLPTRPIIGHAWH